MSTLPLPTRRTLGHSGLTVSPIAWGMWRLAEDGRSAADAGIDFLNTTAFAAAVATQIKRMKLLWATCIGKDWPPQLARRFEPRGARMRRRGVRRLSDVARHDG